MPSYLRSIYVVGLNVRRDVYKDSILEVPIYDLTVCTFATTITTSVIYFSDNYYSGRFIIDSSGKRYILRLLTK